VILGEPRGARAFHGEWNCTISPTRSPQIGAVVSSGVLSGDPTSPSNAKHLKHETLRRRARRFRSSPARREHSAGDNDAGDFRQPCFLQRPSSAPRMDGSTMASVLRAIRFPSASVLTFTSPTCSSRSSTTIPIAPSTIFSPGLRQPRTLKAVAQNAAYIDPAADTPAYRPDSIVLSSRNRISPSLPASEITNRTRPWLEVSA
jgi:hypothetical protein